MQCWILVHNFVCYMFSWLINKLTAALLYSRTVQLHQTRKHRNGCSRDVSRAKVLPQSSSGRKVEQLQVPGRRFITAFNVRDGLCLSTWKQNPLIYHIKLNLKYSWRKYWTENYTGTQSLISKLSYSFLQNFGYFYWIWLVWFQNNSVKTFEPIIFIYRRGNFVYHHK